MSEGRKVRADVTSRLGGRTNKEDANYRPQEDREAVEFCFECIHYTQPGQETSPCRRVIGIVDAHHTCDMWAARDEQSPASPQIVINVGGKPIQGKLNAS